MLEGGRDYYCCFRTRTAFVQLLRYVLITPALKFQKVAFYRNFSLD